MKNVHDKLGSLSLKDMGVFQSAHIEYPDNKSANITLI